MDLGGVVQYAEHLTFVTRKSCITIEYNFR